MEDDDDDNKAGLIDITTVAINNTHNGVGDARMQKMAVVVKNEKLGFRPAEECGGVAPASEEFTCDHSSSWSERMEFAILWSSIKLMQRE
jgi:hypothetical protein